jgi:hypothetical protein
VRLNSTGIVPEVYVTFPDLHRSFIDEHWLIRIIKEFCGEDAHVVIDAHSPETLRLRTRHVNLEGLERHVRRYLEETYKGFTARTSLPSINGRRIHISGRTRSRASGGAATHGSPGRTGRGESIHRVPAFCR